MKTHMVIEAVNRVLENIRPNMLVVVLLNEEGSDKVHGIVEASLPKRRFQERAKEWWWQDGRPKIVLQLAVKRHQIPALRTVDDYLALPAWRVRTGTKL